MQYSTTAALISKNSAPSDELDARRIIVPVLFIGLVFVTAGSLPNLRQRASSLSPSQVTPNTADFFSSNNGGSLTLAAGSNSTGLIYFTGDSGFWANVALSATVKPTLTGAPTVSFNPSVVGLACYCSGDTYMTISTSSSTPARVYNVTMTASGGGVTHHYVFLVMVVPFSLAVPPGRARILQNYTVSFPATVTSMGGFQGTVSFTTSVSPTGATSTVSPSSFQLASGSSAFATVTFLTTADTPANMLYTVYVNASTGGVWQTTYSAVVVDGFAMGISKPSLNLEPGGVNVSLVVSMNGIGMFYGMTMPLVLATTGPEGFNATLNPPWIHLSSPPYGTTNVQISTKAGATGRYNVTVSSTYANLTHSVSVSALVIGDVNGDCKVDIKDLVTAAIAFGKTAGSNVYSADDLNGDGKIDIKDLSYIGMTFGLSC